MFRRIFAQMKKHSWVFGIIITTALGGIGVWVTGVNATGEKVVRHEETFKSIDRQLTGISVKQDTMNDGITEIKERVSNIEGRLGR